MAVLNPDPPEFPCAWATSYGQDRFGLWQALDLNGVRQVMRWIPPGRFIMGSPESEDNRYNNETQHEVLISKGFWLADTACTQALWQSVVKDNPSHFSNNPEHPVESVSWDDCQSWIEIANQKLSDEFTLRLPTEAEWEYAARAGSSTAFWWGDDISTDQANYNGDVTYREGKKGVNRKKTVKVLEFEANDFGLFQMHGNVWEWCQDYYADYPTGPVADPVGPEMGQDRVLRGGSWFSSPQDLRAGSRDLDVPGFRFDLYGFRLAGG